MDRISRGLPKNETCTQSTLNTQSITTVPFRTGVGVRSRSVTAFYMIQKVLCLTMETHMKTPLLTITAAAVADGSCAFAEVGDDDGDMVGCW